MTVLFVCVHNAGRSQMAEALFNKAARASGLDAFAESAGTEMGSEINPTAVQAMAEIGIDMSGRRPKSLTTEMVARADRIISMGCGVESDACPAGFLLTEDWNLDDPAGQPIEEVRVIRDQIASRVDTLVSELKKS